MSEETIWQLEIDGSGAIDTLNALTAAIEAAEEAMSSFGANAGDLSAVDDALAGLAGTSADASEQIAGLQSVIDSLSATISEDNLLIDSLNATIVNLEAQIVALTGEFDVADEGAGGLAAMLGTLGEVAGGVGEALQAAMGPLMMLSTVAGLVGFALYSAGAKGQQGEALLRGMAGASQQDIDALQGEAVKLGLGMDQASQGFYQVTSAGYSGSQALTVFTAAAKLAEGGAASQADTTSALTAVMHDYNASASDAGHYSDLMAEAVFRGKQSMSDFASSIGPLTSAGENVGLSFDQIAAAEATMTQINPHVRQDAQQLTSLFQFLSPTMGGVANAAKGLGISFDEQKYKSEDLLGKLQYLAQISGGTNTEAFVKLTGGVRGSTAAIDLLKNGASTFVTNLNAMGHATGATQYAFDQFENTVPAHMNKIGAAFSIMGTKFMDAFGPKLIPILDGITAGIGNFTDFVTSHMNIMMPILGGLAIMVGVVLVSAFTAWAVSVVMATWPFLLAGAIIAAVVVGIIEVVQHWGQIVGWLEGVWGGIVGFFTNIWHGITGAFGNVGNWFHDRFSDAANAVKTGFGNTSNWFSDRSKDISGAWNTATLKVGEGAVWLYNHNYYVKAFVDEGIQAFNQAKAWITKTWGEVTSWIVGEWQALVSDAATLFREVSGAIHTGFSAAIGFVASIWNSIAAFFSGAWSNYVANPLHSLWTNVSGVFRSAWGTYISGPINSIGSSITSFFSGLANTAISWGANMINGFVSGITGAAGNVKNAVTGIASSIGNFLGFHSPTEEGPGQYADTWGPNLMNMFIAGIQGTQGKLQNVVEGSVRTIEAGLNPQVNQTLALSVNPATNAQLSAPAPSSGNDQAILNVLTQILSALQRQQQGQNSLTLNNNVSPTINSQAINQLVQILSGYGYEGLARGSGGLF